MAVYLSFLGLLSGLVLPLTAGTPAPLPRLSQTAVRHLPANRDLETKKAIPPQKLALLSSVMAAIAGGCLIIFPLFAPIFAVLGIVFGLLALNSMDPMDPEMRTARNRAILGLALCAFVLAVLAGVAGAVLLLAGL